MSKSNTSSNFDSKNIRNVEDVFQLLEAGDKLNLGGFKDITLFIGNTSSGKSSLTLLLGGQSIRSVSGSEVGDYIIIDENRRVAHGIDSVTIFPKEVVDPESNEVFVDCPGFKDTRNSAFDIASTYFIKKVIDNATRVKIIMTVNYSSVRTGVDRFDFMSLIKHITEFIKNIRRFKSSIALVVTKVDYKYDQSSTPPYIPDNIVIDGITKFIKSLKQYLTENIDQKPFYRDAISLLEIIEDKGKVAIFRRPNQEGLISEIGCLQEEKQTIKNMLRKLTFANKTEEDFGWTIDESSKNSIIAAGEKINQNITLDVLNTVNNLNESFSSIINRTKHFDTIKETIVELKNKLLLTIQKLESCRSHRDFSEEYYNFINCMDVKGARTFYSSMLKKYNYIEFFQKMSGDTIKTTPLNWSQPLRNSTNFLENSLVWYTFLTDLFEKISTFSLQTNLLSYLNVNQQINSNNLCEFYNFLEQCNIHGITELRNININEERLIKLNTVVNIIRHNTVTFCLTSGVLEVRAGFIKMSELVNHLNNSAENITLIHVFAFKSFFIDADLIRKGGKLKMVVVAPRWEVIGDRKIVLDGITVAAFGQHKAEAGQQGKPGLPGVASGSFMGFSTKIINGEHLTISVNGGNGGPGQEGGDGIPGLDGPEKNPGPKKPKKSGSQEEGKGIMSDISSLYTTISFLWLIVRAFSNR